MPVGRCGGTDVSSSCNTQNSRHSHQIVLDQDSPTHLPSPPWCKMCAEFRGRDSPHREQLKIDAVVPQPQFDYGYMGNGGLLQMACFVVGTDTSSGAIHATMVPDSKKMDMHHVVAGTATWVRDLDAFVHTETKKELRSCCWIKWQKNVVLKDKTGKFYNKCYRQRAIRATVPRRKPSPQSAVLFAHIWQFSKTKSRLSIRHAAWVLTRYNPSSRPP